MLGRATAGAGSAEELSLGSGLTLSGTTLSVANPTIAGSALNSSLIWVGDGANTAQPVSMSGDASISNTGTVTVAASAITTSKINDQAVNFAKMQNIATNKLLGRSTAASGSPEELSIGSGLTLSSGTLSSTGMASFPLLAPYGTAAAPSYSFSAVTNAGMYSSASNDLSFATNGTRRVTITNGGYVGIGTSVPNRPLYVVGDSFVSGNMETTGGVRGVNFASIGDYGAYIGFPNASGTGTADLQLTTGIGPRLTVKVGGNVGIGTTAPTANLAVSGDMTVGKTSAANGTFDVKGSVVMSGLTSGYNGFRAPAVAGSTIWTLPSADGTAGQSLSTNGAGVLYWSAAGAPTVTGSAALADGGMWLGDSSNVAQVRTLTGDASISNTGVLTLSANSVVSSDITNASVTYSKIQNVSANNKILGRSTAGAGSVEELSLGSGLTLVTGTLSVSNPTIVGSALNAAQMWLGSSSNLAAAVTMSGDGSLTDTGAFSIANDKITYAKMQNVSASARLLGRATAGAGDAEELTIGSGLTVSGTTLSSTGMASFPLLAPNGSVAAPSYSFSGSSNTGMYASASNDLTFATNGANRLSILTSGYIGIGTTNPEEAFHIVGSGPRFKLEKTINDSNPAEMILSRRRNGSPPASYSEFATYQFAYPDTNGIERETAKISAFVDGVVGTTDQPSRLGFFTALDGGVGLNEQMTIKNTGNVGIGTTTPGAKLAVSGDMTVGKTSAANGTLDVNGSVVMSGSTSGYNGFRAPAVAGSTIWTLPSSDGTAGYVLSTNGSGILSWSSGPAPTYPLVAPYGSAAAPSYSFSAVTNAGMYSSASNDLSFATAGANRLTIANGGYVGIGTTNPGSPLEVIGYGGIRSTTNGGGTQLGLLLTTSTPGAGVGLGLYGPSNVQMGEINSIWTTYNTDSAMVFINRGTGINSEKMRILGNGNVGIGTTAPTAKLAVSGDLTVGKTSAANGTLDVNGSVVMSGSTSGYNGFRAPAVAGSTIWSLPSGDGTSGQVLTTNAAGQLYWTTASGGTPTFPLAAPYGTAAAPSYSFSSVTDAGMYSSASNDLSFATSGIKRMSISSGGSLDVSGSVIAGTGTGRATMGTWFANNAFWIDMPTTGPSGIGSGGPGSNAWIASVSGANQWFMGTATGDLTYRNTVTKKIHMGIDNGAGTAKPMISIASGFVGIGTTAPGASLDISGNLRLRGATSGTVSFVAPAVSGSAAYTLPSADGTAGQALTTNGSGILSWSAAGGSFPLLAPNGSAAAPSYSFSSNADIGMYSSASNDLSFATAGNKRMTILTSGNVGVGTANPTAALDVVGTGAVGLSAVTNNTTNGSKAFQATATGTSGVVHGIYGQTNSNTDLATGITGIAAGSSGITIGVYGESLSTNAGFGVYGKASAGAGIASHGVYGLQTSIVDGATGVTGSATGAGAYTAGVKGINASINGYAGQFVSTAATGTAYGVHATSASNTGIAGYFENTNGGYAAVFQGGEVGIGTSTPAHLLTVKGADTVANFTGAGWLTAIQLENTNTGGRAISMVSTSSSDPSGAGKFILYDASNGPQFTLNAANGKVGIGTTVPAEKLEVNGAIKLGNTTGAYAGTLRWTGLNFQGYDGSTWFNIVPNPPAAGACDTVQTFNATGVHSYTVPASFGTITVRVWGGGGSGGQGAWWHGNGLAGGNSSIASLGLMAGGGGFGNLTGGAPGAGGVASGGTVNTNGAAGSANITTTGGLGGSSPNGGAGGNASNGTAPGGGAAGSYGNPDGGAGGGAGAYVEKTFTSLTLAPNATINDIIVGAGGIGPGYNGGMGQVTITCSSSGAPPVNDRSIVFQNAGAYSANSTFVYTAAGRVGIGTSTPSKPLEVTGSIKASGGINGGVVANTDALTAITVDFADTNMVRATGAAAACGTLNVTNTVAGGQYTVTIKNANATCTTINWNGVSTNVILPAGYVGGAATAGVVYTFIDDGANLWTSYVQF